jgi:hypothetical protein
MKPRAPRRGSSPRLRRRRRCPRRDRPGTSAEPKRGELLDGADDVPPNASRGRGPGLRPGRSARCGAPGTLEGALSAGSDIIVEPTNAWSQASADASSSNRRTGYGGLFTRRKKLPMILLSGVPTIRATADTRSPWRVNSRRAGRVGWPLSRRSTDRGLRRPPVSSVIAAMAASRVLETDRGLADPCHLNDAVWSAATFGTWGK